ncbi:MAG: homoserine O-acetyltransferase [Lentisphaeria bacterium]|nr:homoserine O-acetyltransferase [Lentisphaeria bacterium]
MKAKTDIKRTVHKYDPPDSLSSVGMTMPKHLSIADAAHPFKLECGAKLTEVDVEYETYGELSEGKDNVILICHALSGDAHVAGWDAAAKGHPERKWRLTHPGWWDAVIGPGKPIDTERFFVICANVLGSCYGTTGPASIEPATGKPYGLRFPKVTVGDWVVMEKTLLERLGITRLYAVIGGSLGGQQALEWALRYPRVLGKCIIMASGPKLSAQGLGFNAVARNAIMRDVNFANGDYYSNKKGPDNGLAVARMLAHITYLSGKGMDFKFGRERLDKQEDKRQGFEAEFSVESYLNHQSKSFVERFDADSYLYITRAMDYYDAASAWGDGDLRKACRRLHAELMVVSFSSDWLYPPAEAREFVNAILAENKPVTYVEIQSESGHDAFLVDTVPVGRLLRAYLLAPGINRRSGAIV